MARSTQTVPAPMTIPAETRLLRPPSGFRGEPTIDSNPTFQAAVRFRAELLAWLEARLRNQDDRIDAVQTNSWVSVGENGEEGQEVRLEVGFRDDDRDEGGRILLILRDA